MKAFLFLALGVLSGALSARPANLVVHEWGTFTSLQDESGRTIGGINTDDEPVPGFCHDLSPGLVATPGENSPGIYKGVPSCHPDVTMRLETPVVYFHPPAGAHLPMVASIQVSFRGGWLSQFYPDAETNGFAGFDHLTDATTTGLAWNNLMIGTKAEGPETSDRVWTAPRWVLSAPVTTQAGESEKFLFYRGVGHIPCPLQVSRTPDSRTLVGRPQVMPALDNLAPMPITHLWLASLRGDGTCAFRDLPAVTLGGQGSAPALELFSTAADFGKREYSKANMNKLRAEMRQALEADGLFEDEANALLNTWDLSYFQSAGLRLFFLVPRQWTDFYLPMKLSVPADITRVMIGRLELVTPEQREDLHQLASAPVPTRPWTGFVGFPLTPMIIKDGKPLTTGSMPPAYRNLGRFRNALLLDEEATRPSPSLNAFIHLNKLQSAPVALATSATAGP